MECNNLDYITITNIQKMHSILMNSKVSKNIRNQAEIFEIKPELIYWRDDQFLPGGNIIIIKGTSDG